MPKPSRRLSASQRKESIARAVLPVLARKGFDGVTTRELAAVSGISEGLIFRHYPTKDDLCAEIYNYCSHSFELDYARIAAMEPSTESLVRLSYFHIRGIVIKRPEHSEASMRLLYRSLLEDGRYAGRVFGGKELAIVRKKFNSCLAAALAAGDAIAHDSPVSNLFWFSHHIASLVCLIRLAERPAISYVGGVDRLTGELTRFALRGVGVSETVLKRYATAATFSKWLRSAELTLLAKM